MEHTNIIQQGYAYNVGDGTVEYKLETTVDTQGELPTRSIFVYAISTADTPASDEFKRVASVADLTDLVADRDAAIAADATEYRSSYSTVSYKGIDVARQAKTLLASRINELIRTWIAYRDEFQVDDDVTQYFPTASTTEEEQLASAYKDAKDARIEKEDEVTAKDAEIAVAEAEAEAAADIIQIYENEVDFSSTVLNGEFNTYYGLISVEGSGAETYRLNTLLVSFANFRANASSNLAQWKNTKQIRDNNVADLTTQKAQLDAELTAAQAAEDAALAAVLAICPDFDPEFV